MTNNTIALEKGFDRVTAFYDAMACVFSLNRINTSQLAFLSHLSTQKSDLLLGGGTGHFLQKLLKQNEDIQITHVEISAKMIAYAKKRIEKNKPCSAKFSCSSKSPDFELFSKGLEIIKLLKSLQTFNV